MGVEVLRAGREADVWMHEGGGVIGEDEVGPALEDTADDHHFLNFGGPPKGAGISVAVVVCDGVECPEGEGHEEEGVVLGDVLGLLHPLGHIHGGKSQL